jgi:DNA-binding response OmpR family regulator
LTTTKKTRQLLEDHLRARCTVLSTTGTTQAAEVLSRFAVDVVLVDLPTTDADGLQVIDTLCRPAGDVPLVLVAGLRPDKEPRRHGACGKGEAVAGVARLRRRVRAHNWRTVPRTSHLFSTADYGLL